jgi:hypothetical protein
VIISNINIHCSKEQTAISNHNQTLPNTENRRVIDVIFIHPFIARSAFKKEKYE